MLKQILLFILRDFWRYLWQPAPVPPPTPVEPAPPTTTAPPSNPGGTAALTDLLLAHNAVRADAGVSALKLNPKLVIAAQLHSAWQAQNNKMSHTGHDGTDVSDRVTEQGYAYSMVGENVAMGYSDVAAVMAAWTDSPGHYANILRMGFQDAGFGLAADAAGRYYWTAVFARPPGSPAAGMASAPSVYLSLPTLTGSR